MKKLRKVISVVICAVLLSAIPIEAVTAVEGSSQSGTGNASTVSFDTVQGEETRESSIVQEITEERTEFSKEFLLEDGSKMLSVYEQPVHYQNEDKKWVDYDNTLVSSGNDEVTNKNGNININLKKESNALETVKLSDGEYSINWGFEGINNSVLKTVSDNPELSGNEEYTTLKDITSEAVYTEVFKNVDLQYFVSSTGVKENIVLKSADVQNEFNITYTTQGLLAKQIDDYTISFKTQSGNEIYQLLAPYMTDAGGKVSTQLAISLISQENGTIKVRLTVDNNFIKSPDTQFPVIIDPEITRGFSGLIIMDEGLGDIRLMHGPYYVSDQHYVVTKINNLPTLGEGEQIISAKFNYEITNGDTLFESESESPIIFNAHKVNSFNGNVVNRDTLVLDYDSVTYNDNAGVSFDLTKLVKDWYAGTEPINGFTIEANDTVGAKQVNFKTPTNVKPTITIVYKDFKGCENGMSFHTFEAGQNATASVSDYLGNLVVDQALYEGAGVRMPASISAAYNSIGNAWAFSFNQKISAAGTAMAALGYDYIYTDKQGTNHYLKKDETENEWYDEDGLGISLTVGESNLTVENGYTQTYALPANGGMLLSEKDEHNNEIQYNYSDGGVIESITDGAGRNIPITVTNGVVASILLLDNNSIIFNYSDGLLTKVIFPGGRMSRYSYDNGKLVLIEQADNISGSETVNSKLGFVYTGDKVTRVTQYGSDGTEGNYLNFAYGTDNTTVFTDKNGRTETYTFDNDGNRISVLNENGYLESNPSEGLVITGGADSFTKNYLAGTISNVGQYNGKSSDGIRTSNGGSVSSDSGVKYFGTESSVKVENPASQSNAAFYTSATIPLNVSSFIGEVITVSAYVKTSDVVQTDGDGVVGASLSIVCHKANEDVCYNSVGITGTEGWQRLSISGEITEDLTDCEIYCNLRNASGSAWFDCFQLEQGNSVNDYNALLNADFSSSGNWFTEEDTTVNVQNGTVTIGGVAGAYDDVQVEEEIEETTSAAVEPSTYYVEETVTSPMDSVITYDSYGNQIKSEKGFVTRTVKKTYEIGATGATEEVTEAPTEEPTEEPTTEGENSSSVNSLGNKYIYQTVNVGSAGMMFNIVGEAKADSVPLTNEKRTFGIAMNIYYDGESEPETHYQEFNSNTNKRQTVSLSVMPNYSEKVVKYVAFAFVYGYNKNTMTVYSAMLNIAAVGYAAADESSTEPTTTEETTEPTTEEPYDDYIDYEVLSESVDTSQPYMSVEATYDPSGNYLLAQKDETGITTEYEYDSNGNVTMFSKTDYYAEYSYDAANNVTLISNAYAESSYTYNGAGNISAIGHNGFSYTFNYDIYNQLISTAIGNVTIASRTYNSDGVLTRMDFANNQYLQYAYDDYGNLVQATGGDSEGSHAIAAFTYNKKGLVTKAEDFSGGTVTYYQYDFSGNKIGEYRQTDAGALSYHLGYNSNGDKVEKTSINGRSKTITSGTDSNGSFVDNDGVRVGSSADDFGRTTEVKTSYTGTDDFKTLYTYRTQQNSNITTNNIHTITQKHGDTELLKYYYFYDEDGNISSVSETTNKNESFEEYHYDWLSQLKTVIDRQNNTYTRFNYDDGGNLLSVEKSHYDTYLNRPGPQISTNTYTYGDNNWKDKLTAFNGQAFTYDAMGNPLQYRDNLSFEWENGRQLKKVTNNNTTIAMRYDSNGMRTQKGSVRYYYDSDNNLIAMVKGNNTLFFYYDENGSATSFSLNGAMYFYVKNLQGDIVNIADSNGNVQVRYDYDVFGKITAVKNGSNQAITDTSSLAFLNPLRYRGYVFDDETGLYYLQSRYYDPVTGRFLNADVYTDTGSGSPLSTNMFAYCENDMLFKYDKNGKDAVWIQAEGSVSFVIGSFGHTSALFEDSNSGWWYFYWGPESIQMLFLGAFSKNHLNEHITRIIDVYNKIYSDLNIKNNDVYTDGLRFKGLFYSSIDSILYYFRFYNRYSNKYIYKLRFNPDISDDDYNAIINASKATAKKLLKSTTHTRWVYNSRPESLIINSNNAYCVFHQNCMHQSAFFLSKGKLYENADTFTDVMYKIYNEEFTLVPIVNRMIPNSVYYNGLLEYQKILGINGVKLTFRRYQ